MMKRRKALGWVIGALVAGTLSVPAASAAGEQGNGAASAVAGAADGRAGQWGAQGAPEGVTKAVHLKVVSKKRYKAPKKSKARQKQSSSGGKK